RKASHQGRYHKKRVRALGQRFMASKPALSCRSGLAREWTWQKSFAAKSRSYGKAASTTWLPLLPIPVQEVGDPANRHFQIILAGQGDDAEVVRPGPVEGGALNNEDLLLQQ